jgi:hypothetical protein
MIAVHAFLKDSLVKLGISIKSLKDFPHLTTPNRPYALGILLGVLAVLSMGVIRTLPVFLSDMVAIQAIYHRFVELKDYEIYQGHDYFYFDISPLGLRSLANTVTNPDRSPLILLENGVPLSPYAELDSIKAGKAGVFNHWWYQSTRLSENMDPRNDQDRILFSPLSKDPMLNSYTLIVPATSADAFQISQLPIFNKFQRQKFWLLAIIASVVSAWLIRKNRQTASPLWHQVPLILALVTSFFLITGIAIIESQPHNAVGAFSVWDVFSMSPDGPSYYHGYASRGPGYPWFIRLIAGTYDPSFIDNMTPIGSWIENEDHPLFNVSRAQIAALLTAGIVLCFTMMKILRSPLPAIFLLFFYDQHFFIWFELNRILTEPLTQTWLILIVSCFLVFIWKEKAFLLPMMGLLLAGSYLTRQASAYAAIFLVVLIGWALLRNWRLYWKWALSSIAILAAVIAIPDVYAKLTVDESLQTELTYQYRIVHALRVAQPDDINVMPDEESRRWLVDSLLLRDAKDQEFDAICGEDMHCRYVKRISSTYQVAITEASELHEPAFYMKISNAILRHRWMDYLRFGLESWFYTISTPPIDRVSYLAKAIGASFLNTWVIYAVAFLSAGILRGNIGFASVILILAHWAHVMVCCLFSAPLSRMVWATDGLVIIALFLLVCETSQRSFERFAKLESIQRLGDHWVKTIERLKTHSGQVY